MSDFRKLQAKLEKIDESYFSRLAAAADEIALYNQRMPADELVKLINTELGDQAAQYISDKLAMGGRIEENEDDVAAKEQFHNKLRGTDDMFVGFGLNQQIEDELRKISPRSQIYGYDHSDRENLIKVSVRDYHGHVKDMMYDKDTKGFIEPNDKGFDEWLGQNPFESLEETEETQMPDLSRYMVYINRPDVDYIMYHIGRSKAEEGEPRFLKVDKATGDWQTQNWKANNEPAVQQGRGTGPHAIEEDGFVHEEDPISVQVKSLIAQGKAVRSRLAGAFGNVVSSGGDGFIQVADRDSGKIADVSVDSDPHLELVGNIDHYDIIHHYKEGIDGGIDEGVAEWMKRLNKLDEAVVEVPAGLRGEDAESLEQGGTTSRDAERFLADLGPEDSVDTNVVDPETGELLDWPTKDTQRAQDDAEYDKQEAERQRQEDEEEDSIFSTPYIPGGNRKTGPGGVASFDGMDRAMDDLGKLRWDEQITNFYDITWKNIEDLVDDPQQYYDGDYDISWDMPIAIKRTDGQKFTDEDHNNFRRLTSLFRSATNNIGASYVGVSDNGTIARFVPSFY